MALMNCPSCGKQVSDRAEKCPGCGYIISGGSFGNNGEERPGIVCDECGTVIPYGSAACPECGCPVTYMDKRKPADEHDPDGTEAIYDDVEPDAFRKKKRKKGRKRIVALVIVIIIAALGTFIYGEYSKAVYMENYADALSAMAEGASDAEDCGNLIKAVWNNAVYEESDESTDKYTRVNGKFVDFNDALSNLNADEEFQKKLDDVSENCNEVRQAMKELRDPSDKQKEAYDAINDLYNSYVDLTTLVLYQHGSLNSFSEDFSNFDNDLVKKFNSALMYV